HVLGQIMGIRHDDPGLMTVGIGTIVDAGHESQEQLPMRKARAVAAALIVILATSLTAAAQDWPARPVHFIVPFPAGGSTDLGARVIAEYLSRTFGQQVVVENKSGANGNLGVEAVAKSAPDGYAVLVATDSVSSNPHVYK